MLLEHALDPGVTTLHLLFQMWVPQRRTANLFFVHLHKLDQLPPSLHEPSRALQRCRPAYACSGPPRLRTGTGQTLMQGSNHRATCQTPKPL
jgi:hypothetical protein